MDFLKSRTHRQNTPARRTESLQVQRQLPGAIPSRTLQPDYAKLEAMTFRVLARIGFVNGSCMDVPFNVQANDESEVKRQVTPEYVMENVSDDWDVPIANVTVVKAEAVLRC